MFITLCSKFFNFWLVHLSSFTMHNFFNFLLNRMIMNFLSMEMKISFVHLQEAYETFHPPTWVLLVVAFKLLNIRLCLVTNSRAILVIQNNLGTPWVGYLVHKLFDCHTCCAHDNKCCTQFPFARKGCTLWTSRSIKS